MGRICQVCKKKKRLPNPGVSFHRFPKNPVIRKLWFSAVGIKEDEEQVPKHPEICSDHFDPSTIHTKVDGQRYIYPTDTVPLPVSVSPDSSSCRPGDSCPTLPIESVKIEDSKTLNETKKRFDVVEDEWKIKQEIHIKEEDLLEIEAGSEDSCFTQRELPVKVETIPNEIEQTPDFLHCEWNLKEEEFYIKEEYSLEDDTGTTAGLCNQEESEDREMDERRTRDYGAKHKVDSSDYVVKRKSPEEGDLYKCDKCTFQSHYKGNLKIHLLKHKNPDEVELFKCDKCDYQTRHKEYIRRHLLVYSKTPNAGFQCDKCSYRTCVKGNGQIHLQIHKNPKDVNPFKCDKCDYQTGYKSNFNKHVLRHRNLEEASLLKCVECDYQTQHKDDLRRHVLRHKKCEEVFAFKCEQCDYQTWFKSYLKKHLLKHKKPEEVELFKCDSCEYRTKYNRTLKVHVLKHKRPEEVDLFQCDSCGYQTRYRGDLRKHLLRHKQVKK